MFGTLPRLAAVASDWIRAIGTINSDWKKRISMATASPTVSAAPPNRFVHFLVRRRVPISIAVFGILMIQNVIRGTVPHDVLNWTDYRSVAGLLTLLGGLMMRSWAAGFLTKSTQLTMTGPYRLVRIRSTSARF